MTIWQREESFISAPIVRLQTTLLHSHVIVRPGERVDAQCVADQVLEASAIPHFHQVCVVQNTESTAFLFHGLVGGYVLALRIWILQGISEAVHGRVE